MIHGGEAVVVHDLWAGVALRATVRRVEFAGGQGSGAMWVYALEAAAADDLLEKTTLRVIEARHTDLGALSGLTASELKVLALIGEGLSNADIAGRLHRAVKTIESHRAALTEKTGTASRVQLGIMARARRADASRVAERHATVRRERVKPQRPRCVLHIPASACKAGAGMRHSWAYVRRFRPENGRNQSRRRASARPFLDAGIFLFFFFFFFFFCAPLSGALADALVCSDGRGWGAVVGAGRCAAERP